MNLFNQRFDTLNLPGVAQAAQNYRANEQLMGLRDSQEQRANENHLFQQEVQGLEFLANVKQHITPDNYGAVRQSMVEKGLVDPTMVPEQYDAQWLGRVQEDAKANLKKITMMLGPGQAQDTLYNNAEVVQRGDPYDPADAKSSGKGSGKGFEFKSSDANSIRASAASLFGGIYDPETGKFGALDKASTRKVNAITATAQRIYKNAGGDIPHDEAVRQAADKMNIKIDDLLDPNRKDPNNDPLGLFD